MLANVTTPGHSENRAKFTKDHDQHTLITKLILDNNSPELQYGCSCVLISQWELIRIPIGIFNNNQGQTCRSKQPPYSQLATLDSWEGQLSA